MSKKKGLESVFEKEESPNDEREEDSKTAPKKKGTFKRKYQESYLNYGFIAAERKRKKRADEGQKPLLKATTSSNVSAQRASFLAKAQKPFTVDEELILPAAKDKGRELLGEAAIQKISELQKISVLMKDSKHVGQIITAIKESGTNTLQVISDFDSTLTRFALCGKRCPSCHNILETSRLVSDTGKAQLKELFNTYYPIEIDCTRSVEEKTPLMVEWWTKAHNVLVEQKICKDEIPAVVKESNAMFREGYQQFFDVLHQSLVPVLIFSAGIGDILEEVMRQAGALLSNVHILSNHMQFDQNRILCGFKGELIHAYNKREGALLHTGSFEKLNNRINVLLLGDSLGDLNMADGVKDLQHILRIGYLNDKVEENRLAYLDSYDIVLESDETLDVPNAILKYIADTENTLNAHSL